MRSGIYFRPMDDEAFERLLDQVFGAALDRWFYSRVAGTHHLNRDGTHRPRIIAKCAEPEILLLISEPDNAYDSNALKIVRRETGEQLGYVEARAAGEITRDVGKGGTWLAVLRSRNHHPETGKTVGANIALVRLRSEEKEA